MAQKKTPQKKTAPKKGGTKKGGAKKPAKQKAQDGKHILIKLAVAIVLVLIAAGAVAYMANRYAPALEKAAKPQPSKAVAQAPKPKPVPPAPPKPEPVKKPVYEIFDDKHIEEIPEHDTTEPVPPPEDTSDTRPRVAIIIDDMGYGNGIQHKFLDLPYALTYSVLPHSPDQVEIADLAHDKGREVMLHLPMEPMEYPKVDSGPGTLLASMSTDTMMDVLKEDLAAVPHVAGVNNHMGSRLTMESGALYPIFTVLKKNNLFFVDSRTTRYTVCRPSARIFQLPFAQRDVFLDHVRTEDFVQKQLSLLVRLAEKRGQAIGIGHPYRTTYKILSERLPEINEQVKLVPVSELVRVVR